MEEFTHTEWLKINGIITDIYNTRELTEMRRRFLEKTRDLIPFQRAFFDLYGGQNFFDPVAVNLTDANLEEYYQEYEALDYSVWALSQDIAQSYRDTDLISDEARTRSVFFQKWLQPLGIYYEGGCNVASNGVIYGSVTLMRSKGDGDFSSRELEISDILNQHLCCRFSTDYPNGIREKSYTASQEAIISRFLLTGRECELLRLLQEGLSNRQISGKLYISENTAKKHTANIYRKLGISKRAQLEERLKNL